MMRGKVYTYSKLTRLHNPFTARYITTSADWLDKSVLYEDNHLLVVNKPPTILMQKDLTNDPDLLELAKVYVAKKYKKVGEAYLGLVHRIDRPCSGVVVFARTSKAASRLSKSFSDRDTEKSYICVVHGQVVKPGRCHHFLGPSLNKNENKVVVRAGALLQSKSESAQSLFVEAKLAYTPLYSFNTNSTNAGATTASGSSSIRTVLAVDLYTGRKHQIRAQLAHIGHPICGDVKYGAPAWPTGVASTTGKSTAGPGEGRSSHSSNSSSSSSNDGSLPYNGLGIALHSHTLVVPHPTTRVRMSFSAPLPSTWRRHFGAQQVAAFESAIESALRKRVQL